MRSICLAEYLGAEARSARVLIIASSQAERRSTKKSYKESPLRGFLLKFSGVVFAPLEVAVEDNHRGDGVDYFLALFSAGVRLVEVSGG